MEPDHQDTPSARPGYVIDEITGRERKRRKMDDMNEKDRRSNARSRWRAICGKPEAERGIDWIDGDSDMDFSEWEEVNKKRKRRQT